ncbi:MAG: hypothetical protein ACE5ET_02180 [Gammaproteobacteria bacterium]
MSEQNAALQPLIEKLKQLLASGNLPQAEMLARHTLSREPGNPVALYAMGVVAHRLGFRGLALQYFRAARDSAPQWAEPADAIRHLEQAAPVEGNDADQGGEQDRFLLIKSWGCGFWSDVYHVLGQLLVAEISGRIPVVHWGDNSHFSAHDGGDAFTNFFEPLSSYGVDDLCRDDFSYYPAKWRCDNLHHENLNKWHGPDSRISGLLLLKRPENVAVSDFYTGVLTLQPWIPPPHPLHGRDVDAIYQDLIARYLRPRATVLDQVEAFITDRLAQAPFVAVHARGTDKVREAEQLGIINEQYFARVDNACREYGGEHLFLMTDDKAILAAFRDRYGARLVYTACERGADTAGIHMQQGPGAIQRGIEVMVDVYIAARAACFIGNGYSNPSVMVRHLRDGMGLPSQLLAGNLHHEFNTLLHER